jgi:hypothetical protein
MSIKQFNPPSDFQDELQHIRDLVFVRDLLRARGAVSSELRECDLVINEARGRLTHSVKRDTARYATAA